MSTNIRQSPRPPRIPLVSSENNVIRKLSSRIPPPTLLSPLVPKAKIKMMNSSTTQRLLPSISQRRREVSEHSFKEKTSEPCSNSKTSREKCYRMTSNSKNSDVSSRRLVEYFIVVNTVPRERAIPSTPPRSPSPTKEDERSAPQSFEMEDDGTKLSMMSISESSMHSNNSSFIPESPKSSNIKTSSFFIPGSKNVPDSPVSTASTKSSSHGSHTPVNSRKSIPILKLKNKIKSTFIPSPSDHSRYRKRREYGNIQIDVENEKSGRAQIGLDFHPVVTDRYPLVDHEDNPLNPMISHFCFPNSKDFGLRLDYILPKIHYFVLTNDKGQKMYGTCITTYEPYDISSVENEELQLQLEDLLQGHYMSDKLRYKEVYLPKCLCILSSWPYLTAFRTYLTQLYRLATTTDLLEAPVERYIANICSEIPAPLAYELQINIFSSTIRFWAPPANQPIAYVALPYSHLFSCLDIGNIIFVWKALAMERKVLLVSSQLSLLTICSELLPHLYVPVLPSFLTPMLDAPMPYLCGISRDIFASAFLDLAEDVILVDLDKNEVTMGPETPELPDLPQKRGAKLERVLENNVSDIFWKARCVSKSQVKNLIHDDEDNMDSKTRAKSNKAWKERFETFDQAFELSFLPDSLILEMEDKHKSDQQQTVWDIVQEAFFRFYVSAMKDYRKFMVKPSKNESHSRACVFLIEDFIESQSLEYRPFFKEFCHTQQFDTFITKRAYDPGQADVVFFNQSIDAKNNRSRMKLKKVETPFLRSSYAHKQLHTITAIKPNTSDMPKNYVFNYPTWPNKLNSGLFGVPRPIPKIINAEFDRQENLAAQLRSKKENSDKKEDELMDADPSPKVASYTLFFMLYAATTGIELCKFSEESVKEKNINSKIIDVDYDDSVELNVHSVEKSWNSHSASQNEDYVANHSRDMFRNGIDNIVLSKSYDDALIDSISSIDSVEVEDITSIVENDSDKKSRDVLIIGSNENSVEISLQSETEVHDDNDERLQLNQNIFNSLCCGSVSEEDINPIADKTPKIRNIKNVTINNNNSPSPLKNFSTTMIKGAINYTEREEARDVAMAQLNLAFDILAVMCKQNIPAESDVYKVLIEASGRCGATGRATELMTKLNEEGIVPDSVLHTFFLKAFSMQHFSGLNYLPYASSPGETMKKLGHIANISLSRDVSFKSIDTSSKRINSISQASSLVVNDFIYAWVDYGTSVSKCNEKQKEDNRRKKYYVTESIANQLIVGESILEGIHPNLTIDTNIDTCPQCATSLSEHDIVMGWNPCNVHDYTVACPQCAKRFVPHFSVKSESATFIGSQGINTPLYCEFLSPWVLRKALKGILNGQGGIESILKPEWRRCADINAILWWNLILTFSRYRLPISFLLQGSVKNRLITPLPSEKV